MTLAPDLDDETADARAARHLKVLRRLTEMGMDLAEQVHQAARTPAAEGEAPRDPAELAAVFSRISRAVRQTVGLEARLAEGLATRQRKAELRQAWRRRKTDLHRLVGQAIATSPGKDDARTWQRLGLKLDAFEDFDQVGLILDRPLGAVAARLCDEFGLNPRWTLWAQEPWALDEARAQAPGSPFAQIKAHPQPP